MYYTGVYKPLERRPKVPLASALINIVKATKTRQMGVAITDAIIDVANVAIPRSRPNGWRRKYKPLVYRIGQTTVKCDIETKTGP